MRILPCIANIVRFALGVALVSSLSPCLLGVTPDGKKKIVFIAGKPSHGPRQHEYRAGGLLLQKCLANTPGLEMDVEDMGWVKDEKTFDDADAIVIFADGGKNHPAVQGNHLATLAALMKKGVGLGCLHYGVEILADSGGPELKQWIGGYYESMYSVNPMWEPTFDNLPKHPITRGVKPFQIKDEWYFNMRFADGFDAEKPTTGTAAGAGETKFWPILVAKPSDQVRNGPYSAPKGPYDHIVAAKGRTEAMLWAVERPDGGRGFGFTGAHYHDNWANDEYRKTILNALAWIAKVEVPPNGIESTVTKEDLDANLDPKVGK